MKPWISDKDALIFSQMTQMKFKPSDYSMYRQRQSIMQPRYSSPKAKQSPLLLPSSSNQPYSYITQNKQLKYLHSLNLTCFLIGNSYQLDLIQINGSSCGFIDTQYLWTLKLSNKQLIQNLAIDTKKYFLALVSSKSLYLYSYNSKKLNQTPKIIKSLQLSNQIRFLQFAKQAYLSVFYDQYFEVYSIEQNNIPTKKCQKQYGISSQYKIFSIPPAVDSVLNIFFTIQHKSQKTFSLWCIKIIYDLVDIKVGQIRKVYDIIKSLKSHLTISNFNKDTFFLNMECQIIAAKSGFIIDSINVNIQGESSRLVYLQNQRLLHVDDKKLEVYDIKIDTMIKPNRLKLRSVDSLEIDLKPMNVQLINVIPFGKDNFGIFYQLQARANRYTNGQIPYYFCLTQHIKKQQKICMIFNYGAQISNLSSDAIQIKCDMARKIGLSDKQIYLQIWNRTSKSSIQDYKFLLATKDFKTISRQIQKKLKKQSMSFRQLFNIYQSCLDILSKNVFESSCTEDNLQQYLTCHLLVRKLQLFKYMQTCQRQNLLTQTLTETNTNADTQTRFMINIQQFYEYKNFDIKGFFIQHVNKFCWDKKNTINRIRLIMRSFRFVFRIIYRQILQEIIMNSKTNLLSLLQAMPQLLPHRYHEHSQVETSLLQGVWKQISESQWSLSLYIDSIRTIDNSDKVNDLIKSVWYKRYWLTTHDLVDQNKSQIIKTNQVNNSSEIFYFFISSVFKIIKDRKNLEVIVTFLENFYDKLPQHIRGKIFLYVDLWKYYTQHCFQAKRTKLQLNEFLRLNGSQLFKFYFDLQKVRKNSILKQIKPIYQTAKGQYRGIDVFNHGLLQYFQSDLSEISDLKYLLNRMNNEKSQFHDCNSETYQILVQAMQIKLVLGGQNDILIEEILIYIENIPLSKENQVMAELQIVQRINQQADRFRQMKLNMSIRNIIDNCEEVIFKVIQYQFHKHQIRGIYNLTELKQITYRVLAQVQTLKQKIYGDQMNNLPFFIYISQLLQNIQQIELAGQLLEDQFLNRYFTVDSTIVQNLVLYMYKKRFSISSKFKDHQEYVQRIVNLLPQENSSRQFILNQMQFAIALSPHNEQVEFPLSLHSAYPKVNQLMQLVRYLPASFITHINITHVYQSMLKMQQIQLSNNQQQNSIDQQFLQQQIITQHQVYQIFIVRIIELNLFPQAINLIRQIITISFPNEDYNTLYLIILILRMSSQMNDQSRYGIYELVAFAFQEQEEIIKVLDFFVTSSMTSLEKGREISKHVQRIKSTRLNYHFKDTDMLFKNAFRDQILLSQELKPNAKLIIQSTWSHLCNTKPEFKENVYHLVFIILCHEPYMLAKLIYLLLDSINFKQLRSFISYLSQQEIFDEFKVLQFSKRVFYLVLHAKAQNEEINHKLFSFEKIDLNEHIFFKEYLNLHDQNQIKLQKSFRACDHKSKIIQDLQRSRRSNSKESDVSNIQIKIYHPAEISQSAPSQYPFEDSDDDDRYQFLSPSRQMIRSRSKKTRIAFDERSERTKFLKRDGKKLGSYMKQHNHHNQNASQSNTEQGTPTFGIKTRLKFIQPHFDKQMKVKRAMTLSYDPQQKVKITDQLLKSPSSVQKSFVNNLIPKVNSQSVKPVKNPISTKNILKQSQNQNLHDYNNSLRQEQIITKQKQSSQYQLIENSSKGQNIEQTYHALIDELISSYDNQTKMFNFQALKKRQKVFEENSSFNPKGFLLQLRKIIQLLHQSTQIKTQLKINLIRAISVEFRQIQIKQTILNVYTQMIILLERYNLNIQVNELFPLQEFYEQNPSLHAVYEKCLTSIIQSCTIQNLSKLSKVISLAFRKNQYQQQIAYLGLCKLINELHTQFVLGQVTQIQLNLHFDQYKQIINKISTKMLKQKSLQNYLQIQNNGRVKNRFIDEVIQNVRRKGDRLSVEYLKNHLDR